MSTFPREFDPVDELNRYWHCVLHFFDVLTERATGLTRDRCLQMRRW
jgi:hypothetical protein